MRGEHFCPVFIRDIFLGSSPRAWGTWSGRHLSRNRSRFIPTCVGNIQRCSPKISQFPVHPHVRGEHVVKIEDKFVSHGSSPRAWGTWSGRHLSRNRSRFIPTCVGNIKADGNQDDEFSVHPHVRGEHLYMNLFVPRADGSSPRAWGTLNS